MDSPPSPFTPPTPPEVLEARIQEELRKEEERKEKEVYINLVNLLLKKYPSKDNLIAFFSELIISKYEYRKKTFSC